MSHLIAPIQLGSHLWRLGCHHMNLYLIKGQGAYVLFEVGISITMPLVLGQLDALGVAREDVRWLILSHAHSDHSAGQASLIEALPRAVLLMTAGSQRLLSRPSTLGRFSQDNEFSCRQVAQREGLAHGQWPALEPPAEKRLELVEAGQELDLAGIKLRLMSAGGHAPHGLTAWLPAQGALLASDSAGFYQNGGPGFPLYFVSYTQYIQNLERMAALEPQVLGLGHQAHFTGNQTTRYISDTLDHLHQSQSQILKRHRAGQPEEDISRWTFDTYYKDELSAHGPANIAYCCDLLVKRALQAGPDGQE